MGIGRVTSANAKFISGNLRPINVWSEGLSFCRSRRPKAVDGP